jgi:hypothetical protein
LSSSFQTYSDLPVRSFRFATFFRFVSKPR